MRKTLIQGVGINDSSTPISRNVLIEGKYKRVWTCPYYQRWVGMLKRSYSKKFKQKHNTYTDCFCCSEWLTFGNFKSWMKTQDWEGKELDKDLLSLNNKEYSPERCIFISHEINSFMVKSDKTRGEYPLGVYYQKLSKRMRNERVKPYVATTWFENRPNNLGYYLTAAEAHAAWQYSKIQHVKTLIDREIDEVTITGLKRVLYKIEDDYNSKLETIHF